MSVETPTSQPYQGYINSTTWAFSLACNNEAFEYNKITAFLSECDSREAFINGFMEMYPVSVAKKMARQQAAWCKGAVNELEVADEFWGSQYELEEDNQ